ncbi:MAG: hypothetical protein AAF990_12215 [Bacteroidota bacterium]
MTFIPKPVSAVFGLCLFLFLLVSCQNQPKDTSSTITTKENAFAGYSSVVPLLLDNVDSIRGVFRQDFTVVLNQPGKSLQLVVDLWEGGQAAGSFPISDAMQMATDGSSKFDVKINAYVIKEGLNDFNLDRFVLQSVIGLIQNEKSALVQKVATIPMGLTGNYKFDSSSYRTEDQEQIYLMAYQASPNPEGKERYLHFTETSQMNMTMKDFVANQVQNGTGFSIRFKIL